MNKCALHSAHIMYAKQNQKPQTKRKMKENTTKKRIFDTVFVMWSSDIEHQNGNVCIWDEKMGLSLYWVENCEFQRQLAQFYFQVQTFYKCNHFEQIAKICQMHIECKCYCVIKFDLQSHFIFCM